MQKSATTSAWAAPCAAELQLDNLPEWLRPKDACLSVYFAGKISKNDWRHSIVPDLRSAWFGICCDAADPEDICPIRFHALDTTFDYAGPYFVGCDHGCFHGPNSHGIVDGDTASPSKTASQQTAFKLCLQWLRQSDAVFAHVESSDAHGTLFELGWAFGRLPVFLNFASESLASECWFPIHGACVVSVNPDPHAAFLNVLPRLKLCRERN